MTNDMEELEAIHNFDFERVALLLGIVEKQTLVLPKATHLSGIAIKALNAMNEDAKVLAKNHNDKVTTIDTERLVAEQARIRDENAAAYPASNPNDPMQPADIANPHALQPELRRL